MSHVDFGRRLVCILGLPFDAIGVDEAVERIRNDAFAGRRCFVSTPNLNFAISARDDAVFRGSVLRSDLSLVDGMPLVWIAALMGLPIHHRVSGSDVFDALQRHAGEPLNVYLFGGPEGAGRPACDSINRRGGGLRCVGYDSPGYGSVESMSGTDRIDRINRSGAHFVVVALGARKGQAWIEHNAAHLTPPILSHLGAVVNFAAGAVRRAPRWMQAAGLEWLWRIKEEPSLWRRYWHDGRSVVGLLGTHVLPDAFVARRAKGDAASIGPRIESAETSGGVTLALHGSWAGEPTALREALASHADGPGRVTIDLSGVSDITSACIATLLIAVGWFGSRLFIVGASDGVADAFRRNLAQQILSTTTPF